MTRKPNTFEIFSYKKLDADYHDRLLDAASLLDKGRKPEEVAEMVGRGQALIGVWIFFAANYMVLTGIRPQCQNASPSS